MGFPLLSLDSAMSTDAEWGRRENLSLGVEVRDRSNSQNVGGFSMAN